MRTVVFSIVLVWTGVASAQVPAPQPISDDGCSGGISFTLEQKVTCFNQQAQALEAAKRAYAQDEVARLKAEVARLEGRAERAEARSGKPPVVNALANAMSRGERRAALFQQWRKDREAYRIDGRRMAFDNTVNGFACSKGKVKPKKVNVVERDVPVSGSTYSEIAGLIKTLGMNVTNVDGNFVHLKHNGHSDLREARNAALSGVREDAARRGCDVAIALAFFTEADGAYFSGTQLVVVDEKEKGEHIVFVLYGTSGR